MPPVVARLRNRNRSRSRFFERLESRFLLDGVLTNQLTMGPHAPMSDHGVHAVTVTHDAVISAHDTIPRFAANPTHIAHSSGNWSDPEIWNAGEVPGENAIVQVPDAVDIVYDRYSPIPLDAIEVSGTLRFDTQQDTSLWINELMVLPEGTLTIGTSDAPVARAAVAEIVFTDQPDAAGRHFKTGSVEAPGLDPEQFGNGLIVFGTFETHGAEKSSYVRATHDIEKGQTSVTVDAVPFGWEADDRLLLPQTSQSINTIPVPLLLNESETVTLAEASESHLTFTESTNHSHHGISDNPFGIERFAHVANLTRNVVLRSQNPSGVRGHFIATGDADVRIQNTLFLGMGRTSASRPVDNTFIDHESGLVQHIGENMISRYPIHFHHLRRPFLVRGSVVEDGLKWGVTVHNSQNGVFDNNIVFDTDGAGVVTEDGTETGNTFSRNLIVKVDGGHQIGDKRAGVTWHSDVMGNRFLETAADGSGFWLRASANAFTDNVVYDAAGYAYNFNGYYRTSDSAEFEYRQVDQFSNNEAVSSVGGLWLTWSQGQRSIEHYSRQAFEDLLVWHVSDHGVLAYHDGNITLRGITVVGNPSVSNANEGSHFRFDTRATIGLDFGNRSYENFNLELSRINVSGTNIGLISPTHPGNLGASLRDARLMNHVNIAFAQDVDRQTLVTDNVQFLPSQVVGINQSLPEEVANIWHEGIGTIEGGDFSDAIAGTLVPPLPASIRRNDKGELNISGGEGVDVVTVTAEDSTIVVGVNDQEFEFHVDLISRIIFRGHGGDDQFRNATHVPSTVIAGAGNDYIQGGLSGDTISGDEGNDTIFGGDGDDVIYGNQGMDFLSGGAGIDRIRGGLDDDFIDGGAGSDELLAGGDGNDTLVGGTGNDVLIGDDGDDNLVGGPGDDRLNGGEGNDSLHEDDGSGILLGESGVDLLFGGLGRDRLRDGLGIDAIVSELDDVLLAL